MAELYVDSVAHSFGGHSVLNNVYLKCGVGEVVGVLGRNGSGKSTLLKIIFGSIKPNYKFIRIDDELVQKGYLTHKIAYLPQGYFLPQYLSLELLVNLYVNKYREQLLAIDLFREHLKVRIGDLSGGHRRLAEALLMIYSDAKYILLDEPFSQLAPLISEQLKYHIRELLPEKGFIVTDHDYQQILDVSSRVVLIHNACNYNIGHTDDLILHGYLPAHFV